MTFTVTLAHEKWSKSTRANHRRHSHEALDADP